MRSSDAALRGRPRAESLAWPWSVSPGALVLAATVPIVFLHVEYQPAVSLPLGATFKLSDAMVLLTALAALTAAFRGGLRPLRPGLAVWVTSLLFLGWVAAAIVYPLLSSRPYAWRTHVVTAAEFWEYALLAPAVPLLVRRRDDVLLVLGTVAAWGTVATVVAVVQWFGWAGLGGWGRGLRQPSFLGPHDLAGLAGMLIGIGALGLLGPGRLGSKRSAEGGRAEGGSAGPGRFGRKCPSERGSAGPGRVGRKCPSERGSALVTLFCWATLAIGVVGFVLGGATAGIVGLVPAAVAVLALAARRGLLGRRAVAAVLAATAVAALGVLALRAGDFTQFLRFLGVRRAEASTSRNIQTYSQRTLLAYIGVRIWVHHPLVGVGWQGSAEPAAFEPELPAAHRRFPDVTPVAFPSAQHAYGVQVMYVQVLADLGVVGAILLGGLLVAAGVVAVRGASRAPPATAQLVMLGLFWFLLALGLWTALGLVAGVPLDALTWLALGLVCTRPADG